MKQMNIFMLVGLSVAIAQPVRACDLCAVFAASEAQGGDGKGFFGGVAGQFTEFGTLQADGREIANAEGAYIHSFTSQLFAGYNFNQHVGVQFNLPMIYRDYGTSSHASEAGIGDVSLLGNFRIYEYLREDFTFNWTALGGITFPTGDSSKLNTPDFAEGIGGHDLALGSGSFDELVGTGFLVRWQKLFFTGNMQYAIRTEGDFHHQYANDWTWAGGPGAYLCLKENSTLTLQAMVSGESKGADHFGNVADEDSAETAVYLGPQINFTWGNRLGAQLGIDLPVSIDNTGSQLVPDYRMRAAITWRF